MHNIIILIFSFFTLNSILSASLSNAGNTRSNNPYSPGSNSAFIYEKLCILESQLKHTKITSEQALTQSQEDRQKMSSLHKRVDENYNFTQYYLDQTVIPFIDRLPNDLLQQSKKDFCERLHPLKEQIDILEAQMADLYLHKTAHNEALKETSNQQKEYQKEVQTLQQQLRVSEKKIQKQEGQITQLLKSNDQLLERVLKLEGKQTKSAAQTLSIESALKKTTFSQSKIQEELDILQSIIEKSPIIELNKLKTDFQMLCKLAESQKLSRNDISKLSERLQDIESRFKSQKVSLDSVVALNHRLLQPPIMIDASTSTNFETIEQHFESDDESISFLSDIPPEDAPQTVNKHHQEPPSSKEEEEQLIEKTSTSEEENPLIISNIEDIAIGKNGIIIQSNSKIEDTDKTEILGIVQKVINEFLPSSSFQIKEFDPSKQRSKKNFLLENLIAHPVVQKMNKQCEMSGDEYKMFQTLIKRQCIEYGTNCLIHTDIDHKMYVDAIEYVSTIDSYGNQSYFFICLMDFILKNKEPMRKNVLAILKNILTKRISFFDNLPPKQNVNNCFLSQLIMIQENVPLITNFLNSLTDIPDAIFFVDFFKKILDHYNRMSKTTGLPDFKINADVIFQRSELKYFILKYEEEDKNFNREKIEILKKTFFLFNDTNCKQCIKAIIEKESLTDIDILCLKVIVTSLNIVYIASLEGFLEVIKSLLISTNAPSENVLKFYSIVDKMHESRRAFKPFKKEALKILKDRALTATDLK